MMDGERRTGRGGRRGWPPLRPPQASSRASTVQQRRFDLRVRADAEDAGAAGATPSARLAPFAGTDRRGSGS